MRTKGKEIKLFEDYVLSFEGTEMNFPEEFLVKANDHRATFENPDAESMFRMFQSALDLGASMVTIPKAPQPTGLRMQMEGESLRPTINGKEIPGLVSIVQETKVKKNGRTEDLVTLKIKL